MTELAVQAQHLSKQYKIGEARRYSTLRESLVSLAARPLSKRRTSTRGSRSPGDAGRRDTIWALDDVSFDIRTGDSVAIIGKNGSGKSTLLKLLSRITEPTRGTASIYGRVASLLEVGTGFHPELTGRENIFLNGAILGMSRADILARFDEIVAFSEIERFLDTPVKYYSSGMYVRLAFSVAAHLEPDILVIDEVLAVGDSAFQKKCLGKMEDVSHGGRTILFVSHNMPSVLHLCSSGILLRGGHKILHEKTRQVVDAYIRELEKSTQIPLVDRSDRRGTGQVRFVRFEMCDSNGLPISQAVCGSELLIKLSFETTSPRPTRNFQLALGVHGRLDDNLFLLSTEVTGMDFGILPSQGTVTCTIPRLPLLPGRYSFTLFSTAAGEISDWIENAGLIEVEPGDYFGTGRLAPPEQGAVVVEHRWSLN